MLGWKEQRNVSKVGEVAVRAGRRWCCRRRRRRLRGGAGQRELEWKVYAGCLSAGRLSNIRINPTGKVSCRHGGSAITWNQTGPAGAQGLTGPQGPQGARGPAGAQGVQGVQGVQGQTGSPGANGNTVLHGSGAPASTL